MPTYCCVEFFGISWINAHNAIMTRSMSNIFFIAIVMFDLRNFFKIYFPNNGLEFLLISVLPNIIN